MIGKSLLHYRITAALGMGGMGEVYRATDTKLDREVAIKVLPPTMTKDPERVARFQREARTLASLNHPNIAGLFGFETAEDQRFLVMELVEGETLAERIERGAIPLEDALDIARQIADGLEEAHEKGIVHRDLKPANVKLTPDDKVKILDFGLARAYQGDIVGESSTEHSPTITAAMTQQGMILGTAAYMSPEQAKGKIVDRRADLWSFGVVLWEMLAGKRLFSGETVSDTLAAVLRADPDYSDLPANTPPAVKRMLERCLERDSRKRLRDIGEARVRLERWRDDPTTMSGPTAIAVDDEGKPKARRMAPWLLVGVAAAVAVWGWMPRASTVTDTPDQMLRIELELNHEDQLAVDVATNVVISPDGTTLAYIANGGIWVRPLDQLEARELPGSSGATAVAFSPDSQWLAFPAGGRIWRTNVTGGAPFEVCQVADPRGVAWANQSTLVFTPGITGGLWTASVEDGSTRELTTLDGSRNERSHRWPQPLPDGKSVIFIDQFFSHDYDQSDIQIVSLETGERQTVYRGGAAPHYLRSGHLLFARQNTVFAVRLDLESGKTEGPVVPVLDEVWTSIGDQEACDGSAQFAVSDDGILVYRKGIGLAITESRLAKVDFATRELELLSEVGRYATPLLSPNGKYLAYCLEIARQRDIHILETETGLRRQLTFADAGSWLGGWSPDSQTLYWARPAEDSRHEFFRQPVDGSAPEEMIYRAENTAYPSDVSPDGKHLLFTVWTGADTWDVHELSLEDLGAPTTPVFAGPGMQIYGHYSPDGRWLAYVTGNASQGIGYVTPNPPTGARWEIAQGADDLEAPLWSVDASAFFVRDSKGFLRVPLTVTDSTVRLGHAKRILRENNVRVPGWWASAILPDGSGAYVLQPAGEQVNDSEARIVLVTDWLRELKDLAP